MKLFFWLAVGLGFGMMVLSVFTTLLAYLVAFGLVGAVIAGLLWIFTQKPTS